MKQLSPTINRIGYVLFTVIGIVKPILSHDLSEATTLGIALAFDPFDATVPLTQRPWWQQGILYVQLTATLVAVGALLFK